MPKWLEKLGPYVSAAIIAIATLFASEGVARVIGSDLPTWTLFLIAAALGVTALFFNQLAGWLWHLYQEKKLKYFLGVTVLVIIVTWLGWPWPRIPILFDKIRPKQSVISEIWMSEEEAEQFVIRRLQDKGNKDVFPRRVRILLNLDMGSWAGRFKCEEDSIWRSLTNHELRSIANVSAYEGSHKFSEFIGCAVQYSTEYIYQTNWVELDDILGRVGIAPE